MQSESVTLQRTEERTTFEDGHRDETVEAAPTISLSALALNVEAALWLAVLALGAVLRLGALDRWPLAGHEALVALAAAGEAAPIAQAPPTEVGPLLFNLVALGSWLFGASDVAVRIFPALAGVLLVALPWAARGLIGRGPALGAALFIATSPALSFFARRADDTVVSALAALWLVVAFAYYAEHPSTLRAYHVALALGVGLTSGAGFWGVLLAGGLYLLLLDRQQRKTDAGESVDPAWDVVSEARQRLAADGLRLGLTVAAVGVVVSTAAFTNPTGLAQALAQPARWLWLVFGRGPELALPFSLTLVVYELAIVIWAALGGALWLDSRPHWTRFLVLWAGVILVPATLTNSGWAGGVAHAVLPLTLLAGAGLAQVAGTFVRRAQLGVEGLYGGLAFLGLGFAWLTLLAYSLEGQASSLWLAIGGVTLIGGVLTLMAVWVGLEAALRTAGAVVAVVLLLGAARTTWHLTYENASDPREPLVVDASDPDLRYLSDFLRAASENRTGHPDRLHVAVQSELGPAALWYLRDFRQVELTEGSHPDQAEAVLLAASEPPPPGWHGQRVRLGESWTWPGLSGPALVRWLVFREAPGVVADDAVLYLEVPS